MNMHRNPTRAFFLSILGLFGVVSGFAQASFPVVEHFSAPVYPAVARAVRATGTVIVSVEIDEKGRVLSAKAITGHPLLQRSAENASKKWSFSSLPGLHFVALRFEFKLGYFKKDMSEISGQYRFDVVQPHVKVVQNTVY